MDISDLRIDPPQDPENWRYVVFVNSSGWMPITDADRTQREVDAISNAEKARLSRLISVKDEAQRRIIAMTGASDFNGCLVKQLNALMRATELANKGAANWSAEEAAEAAFLQRMTDTIKSIRAASNAIEAMRPIPDDFAADKYWT